MWIQAKHTVFKTVYNDLTYGWPHARIMHWCLLWCFILKCVHAPPPAHSVIAVLRQKFWIIMANKFIQTTEKSWTVTKCGHVTIELCTNCFEARQGCVFIAHFSIYLTQCHCHAASDISRLHGHTLQTRRVVCNVRHWISGCRLTIHWKFDARMQNWQIKSLPALSKLLFLQLAKIS